MSGNRSVFGGRCCTPDGRLDIVGWAAARSRSRRGTRRVRLAPGQRRRRRLQQRPPPPGEGAEAAGETRHQRLESPPSRSRRQRQPRQKGKRRLRLLPPSKGRSGPEKVPCVCRLCRFRCPLRPMTWLAGRRRGGRGHGCSCHGPPASGPAAPVPAATECLDTRKSRHRVLEP